MLVREKVQVDPAFKTYLKGIPVDNYASMINFAGGQMVAHNPRKKVRLIEGSGEGEQRRYYLKQAFSMGPLQILKAFLRGRKVRMITERELELLRLLKGQGVPVMQAVAWGSRRLGGIPLSGFLLVEEVRGERFVDLYQRLDKPGRRRLMSAYGALVGFMHSRCLDSIVRVTDMICVSTDFADFKKSLVLIDREWGALRKKTFSLHKRCQQLGKMYAKMLRWVGLPTDREVMSFARGYLKESPGLDYARPQILERSAFYALRAIKGQARYGEVRDRFTKAGHKNIK